MQDAVSVHRALVEHGVAHEVVRLPRPLQSADELPEVLGLDPASCAVVRCYTARRPDGAEGVHAVVVPAGAQPLPGALRAALAADDVREATDAEINQATDCAARLVTAVALPPAVPVVLDASLDRSRTVWAATGESGTAVGLAGDDLTTLVGGRVLDLTGARRRPVIDLTVLEAPARHDDGDDPGSPWRMVGS